jgi:predicted outer membrane protein
MPTPPPTFGRPRLRGAYASQQVVAHAAAVAVEDSLAAAGADPALQAAAQAALPIVRAHLMATRQLVKILGGGG